MNSSAIFDVSVIDLISGLSRFSVLKDWDNNLFEHEHIYVCKSERFGFTALIAIHSTVNEQAIGGCRYKEYTSFEAALNDVLRLSKAMSLKNKLCGVPFGGGKSGSPTQRETTS